ncbi:hypothetical protein Cni_G16322 [Canna indica]|uniref:Uncharacterized protein n=1 Tax=Canna indica TaxID=4628 RepID=A0AAQ3KEY6_9LILI|nr:hypothetical protein Cni_G16322 [Canna indica]
MAYGGGGIAIIYPLAEALSRMLDECIERNEFDFANFEVASTAESGWDFSSQWMRSLHCNGKQCQVQKIRCLVHYLRISSVPTGFVSFERKVPLENSTACQIIGYGVGVGGWAIGLKLGSKSKGIEYTIHWDIVILVS